MMSLSSCRAFPLACLTLVLVIVLVRRCRVRRPSRRTPHTTTPPTARANYCLLGSVFIPRGPIHAGRVWEHQGRELHRGGPHPRVRAPELPPLARGALGTCGAGRDQDREAARRRAARGVCACVCQAQGRARRGETGRVGGRADEDTRMMRGCRACVVLCKLDICIVPLNGTLHGMGRERERERERSISPTPRSRSPSSLIVASLCSVLPNVCPAPVGMSEWWSRTMTHGGARHRDDGARGVRNGGSPRVMLRVVPFITMT